MSNYVFLIDANKKPLNPIHPAQARKLLDAGKTAVYRRYPFTLILKRVVENPVVHPLTLKIDPGSKVTGISLVSDRNEVIFAMELEHRGQQIKSALLSRQALRRGRRNRKTRYRQARFLNRKRPRGWLPPSLRHRVLTTETWVKRLCKLAPIGEIRQELVRFDTQKIDKPEISGIEYQQGSLFGYEVREYLLAKWDRKCAYCGDLNVPLQVEHIHPRAKGGSNRISNLCLACSKCNIKKGIKPIEQFLQKKPDLLKRILAQAKRPYLDAACVNSTRWALFESLKKTGLSVTTGTGGQTKYNRIRLGLPKTHWLDAACVGITETLNVLPRRILKVKATGMGGRQRCQTDKYGYPVKTRPMRPILGFCTGDIVRAVVPSGKYKGTFTARVCPMSDGRGEFVINKKRRSIKLDYCTPIHRKDGYSYSF
ncbi:MAG: RNA-guided endonuclease IscB [Coleofasciculus chthonoplastes F3-SA18-01]|uniref:RNA-guided endonuclease IscB n=1 Tax=Coleofasciculus chthonoplastes TaxID=64178 RepID=UPI0032F1F3E5